MTRKTKILLTRWSMFATLFAFAFWGVWYAVAGSVPETDTVALWPFGTYELPFAVSRWWDVPLAVPWVLAVWRLGRFIENADVPDMGEPKDVLFGGLALIGGFSMLAAACVLIPEPEGAMAAMLIIAATGTFMVTLVHQRREAILVNGTISLGIPLLVLPFTVGIVGAAWRCPLIVAACGTGFMAATALRQAARPLLALGDWLSGDGIEEAPPAVDVARSAPAPDTNPLAEFDAVSRELVALDAEETRLDERRKALESRLEAMRNDPETSKRLALRSERPAA